MSRLLLQNFCLIVMLILLSFSSASAEFACQLDVSYRWRKKPDDQKQANATPAPAPSPAAAPEAAGTPATDPNVTQVFWRVVEKGGASEEEAKARVAEFAKQEQSNALAACRASHQNLAGCISTKYASMSPTLTSLGFTARKSLEEAIEKDCRSVQGECLDAPIGEIKCVAPKAEEGKEGEKGGDKGAKDGKKK